MHRPENDTAAGTATAPEGRARKPIRIHAEPAPPPRPRRDPFVDLAHTLETIAYPDTLAALARLWEAPERPTPANSRALGTLIALGYAYTGREPRAVVSLTPRGRVAWLGLRGMMGE